VQLAASWPQDLDVAPLREIVDRIQRLGWARITGSFESRGVPREIIHNDQPQSWDYGKYVLAIAVLLVGDLAAIDLRFHDVIPIVLPSNVFGFLKSGASDEGWQVGSRDNLLDAVKETTSKLITIGYPGAADWELPPDEWWQGTR